MKKAIVAAAVSTSLFLGLPTAFAQESPPPEHPASEPATPPADQPAVQQAQDAAIAETTESTPQSEKPKKNFLNLPKGWSGAVELGLSGSDGNTENFNMRAGFDLARKIGLGSSALNLTYRHSAEGGDVTANRFVASARHDQRFSETSRWRYFISGVYEYDDFQDWRQRITLGNGLGYAFIEDENTTFIGRVGVGASRRWGGADEDWIPEGILGFDFEHKLSERTSVYAHLNYLPDLSQFTQYRLNTSAGIKIVVDPELGLNLHAGFEDRYDSNPGPGSQRNDIDYFLTLGWKF
ncbi:MAG: DUF481 domain-containing protein [Phycisphaeraceae bacterium]|nr:DUF481 domain-containing protein [Phycisphaeraceae bacterium]